jgi:eukaryotic-like serine/threonine-protein kinase
MKLPAGFRVGPYEIVSLLGSGGMGDVYRSRDTVLGREVALKILPAEFTNDASRLSRFQQEARLASSLNHPNIVTIYGVGTHDGISYIAMELVTGKTVAELLKDGPLPLDKAVSIAAQAADAMAKAHAAGIVHRDLKPQNLMLNEDGLVKILDFGLSKAVPSGHSLASMPTVFDSTATGVIMGTAKYMSPEQASGKTMDFRSDQFSFAAVLYEMLTGRPPFDRPTVAQLLTSIIENEPPSLSETNTMIPENLESIVRRCMNKNPEGRYASTQLLLGEIQAVQKTIGEAKPRLRPALTRTWKRHWRWIGAVAVGLAMLGAVLMFRGRHVAEFQVASIPAQKQLAILPFTSVDTAAATPAFLDGLVETLSNRLTLLERDQPALRVIPASEVQRQSVTTPQAARQVLGATLVLSGS